MLVLLALGCTPTASKNDDVSPTTVCVSICGLNQTTCLGACPEASDACVKSCSDPYRECVKACAAEAKPASSAR